MTNSYTKDRESVISGNTTFETIVQKHIGNINANSSMNAFLLLNDNAIQLSKETDKRACSLSSIDGMNIAIKDNISTKGIRTTCASKMLQDFIPVYDATVISRLKQKGAIILGKANMDEFAMGSSGETSYFGATDHPLFTGYVPGGSSSGSAAAVAAGFCHAALGSDTGGSVRQPAAFCGVYGFKPSYGRISRYGLIAFASSLDQIGIFARDIDTVSLVFDSISGEDEYDSTCSRLSPSDSFSNVDNSIDFHSLTIAILPENELLGLSQDVRKVYDVTIQSLKKAGCTFKELSIPASSAWIPTYYILATAEASSNLARYDAVRYGTRVNNDINQDMTTASRSDGFGKEVQRRIMLGTYVLSSGYYEAYYKKAQKARRVIVNGYKSIFDQADLMLLPTTPTAPFKRGEKSSNPLEMYLSDYFTVSANIAGIPAISFPAGHNDQGLPIGLQLQATFNQDEKLLHLTKHIASLII